MLQQQCLYWLTAICRQMVIVMTKMKLPKMGRGFKHLKSVTHFSQNNKQRLERRR